MKFAEQINKNFFVTDELVVNQHANFPKSYNNDNEHPTIYTFKKKTDEKKKDEELSRAAALSRTAYDGPYLRTPFLANINGELYSFTNPVARIIYGYLTPLIFRRMIAHPLIIWSKFALLAIGFFGTWYIMLLGGALATHNFPRVDQNHTAIAFPDVVYNLGTKAELDEMGICGHGEDNWFPGADMSLTVNLFAVIYESIYGIKGHQMFQRAIHLSMLCFCARATVVGLTGMNQPNGRCAPIQNVEMSYKESISFVFENFPHKACGDMIFSGHTALIFIWTFALERQNGFMRNNILLRSIIWILAIWGCSLLVLCRSHYTVDVALGIYFAYFIQDWYFSRVLNCFNGDVGIGRIFRNLEYWGPYWEACGSEDPTLFFGGSGIIEKMPENWVDNDNDGEEEGETVLTSGDTRL